MEELKYFKLAHELNNELKSELMSNNLHFRGNRNSFSLISLDKETPEIGIGRLKTRANAIKKFNELTGKPGHEKRALTKGRDTREKELQAWIIRNALNNKNRLFFDKKIEFVTSELSLILDQDKKSSKRVVNDILGLNDNNEIVVIELKSSREKIKLTTQVEKFSKAINQNKKLVAGIIHLLTDRKWNGKIKKMIVWPASSKKEKLVWEHDIKEFSYVEVKRDNKKHIEYDKQGNIIFG